MFKESRFEEKAPEPSSWQAGGAVAALTLEPGKGRTPPRMPRPKRRQPPPRPHMTISVAWAYTAQKIVGHDNDRLKEANAIVEYDQSGRISDDTRYQLELLAKAVVMVVQDIATSKPKLLKTAFTLSAVWSVSNNKQTKESPIQYTVWSTRDDEAPAKLRMELIRFAETSYLERNRPQRRLG